MKIKYVGFKKDLKLKRKDLSKPYDFSKGECDVVDVDAKVLLTTCPKSFKDLTPPAKVKE